MKTPSDDLFTLIKSLNTREKGFFKVYSAKKSFNNNYKSYLQLFDIIDKLKVYDESLLIAKLKKKGFEHKLKTTKSYLTKAILSSLREYHADISVNAELQKMLLEAEVLIEKKLIPLAKKTLMKAEKLAQEHEMYDCLISICSLKTKIIPLEMNIKDMEGYIRDGMLKEKKYLEHANNIIEFRNLISQVRLMESIYSATQDRERVHEINSILNSPLLSSPDKALSFSALKDYYTIHILCAKLLNKWDHTIYQRQKEWITYLESDKTTLPERTDVYFSAIMNLMLIQIYMRKIEEAENIFKKIKKNYSLLPPKKRTKKLLDAFAGATSNYMMLQYEQGNPEEALKAWEQIKESFFVNKLNHALILTIYVNLSHIYFMLSNYPEALKWTNKILDFKEKNILDRQAMNRVYLLVVHYELDHYDMLPYIAKSSQRFLIKHNFFTEFEKIMIHFFVTEIAKTNKAQEKIEAFRQLKKQLEELLKGNQNIPELEYFDYMAWIKSKIENRPFVEIVREKVQLSSMKK